MRSKLVGYGFFFLLIFTGFYLYFSINTFQTSENQLKHYSQQISFLKDSISSLHEKLDEANYFTIHRNEDALSYLERDGANAATILTQIEQTVYKTNILSTRENHELIPYASMTDGKILINQIKILNHKWILADFSDGKNWGELFIEYYIDSEGQVKLELKSHLMYLPSH